MSTQEIIPTSPSDSGMDTQVTVVSDSESTVSNESGVSESNPSPVSGRLITHFIRTIRLLKRNLKNKEAHNADISRVLIKRNEEINALTTTIYDLEKTLDSFKKEMVYISDKMEGVIDRY